MDKGIDHMDALIMGMDGKATQTACNGCTVHFQQALVIVIMRTQQFASGCEHNCSNFHYGLVKYENEVE